MLQASRSRYRNLRALNMACCALQPHDRHPAALFLAGAAAAAGLLWATGLLALNGCGGGGGARGGSLGGDWTWPGDAAGGTEKPANLSDPYAMPPGGQRIWEHSVHPPLSKTSIPGMSSDVKFSSPLCEAAIAALVPLQGKPGRWTQHASSACRLCCSALLVP